MTKGFIMKRQLQEWAATACMILGLYFGTLAIMQASGCQIDQTTIEAGFAEAKLLIETAKEERLRLQAKPDKTPSEIAALAEAEATIAELERLLDEAQLNYEEGGVIRAVTEFIPPPWNVPASIVFGSLGTWWKGRKGRTSFQALVGALNEAKARHGTLATALDEAGDTIKASMGEKASAVVDLGRKKGKFPII